MLAPKSEVDDTRQWNAVLCSCIVLVFLIVIASVIVSLVDPQQWPSYPTTQVDVFVGTNSSAR